MDTTENKSSIFPKGQKASPDYFTGEAWVQMLLPNNAALHCQIGNVTFEAGARNNWHTHSGGQILIVTSGKGYYQEKGKPIQLISAGETIAILPGIVHWHGAAIDSAMTHIAINPNTQMGIVEWLGKVTDEEYNSFK